MIEGRIIPDSSLMILPIIILPLVRPATAVRWHCINKLPEPPDRGREWRVSSSARQGIIEAEEQIMATAQKVSRMLGNESLWNVAERCHALFPLRKFPIRFVVVWPFACMDINVTPSTLIL